MGKNTVTAKFSGKDDQVVYTKKVYQYDRGIYVHIEGLELPEKYQAHFSDSQDNTISISKNVTGPDILIPDTFLRTGKYVYIWLYLADTDDESNNFGISIAQIIVPVEPRPNSLSFTGSGIIVSLDEDDHALIFDTK